MGIKPNAEQKLDRAIALERRGIALEIWKRDPIFIWKLKYPAFIWFASLLHFIWGVVLISSNQQIRCVPLSSLYDVIPNPTFLGLTLIVVGLLAICPATRYADALGFKIVTLMPQQVFTLISGFGAMKAISAGQYADGVARSRSFIFTDQLPALLAVTFHSFALLSFIYLASQGTN